MSKITIEGTSKIEINTAALQQALEEMLPDDFTGSIGIKLDARGNVKSTFLKVVPGKTPADEVKATIYTGAVSTEGEDHFKSGDGIGDNAEIDMMLFISAYALVKAMANKKFDMPPANMPTLRVEDDFKFITDNMDNIRTKYTALAATVAPTSAPRAASSSTGTRTKAAPANANPHAGEELKDVPQVEIPEDLDLTGVPTENPFPTPEEAAAQAEVEDSTEAGSVPETDEEAPVDPEEDAGEHLDLDEENPELV